MRKQDKVTIEKSMYRIELRARVRKVMVEAMENITISHSDVDLDFTDIVLAIQNHLTDKGFEVVEVKAEVGSSGNPADVHESISDFRF